MNIDPAFDDERLDQLLREALGKRDIPAQRGAPRGALLLAHVSRRRRGRWQLAAAVLVALIAPLAGLSGWLLYGGPAPEAAVNVAQRAGSKQAATSAAAPQGARAEIALRAASRWTDEEIVAARREIDRLTAQAEFESRLAAVLRDHQERAVRMAGYRRELDEEAQRPPFNALQLSEETAYLLVESAEQGAAEGWRSPRELAEAYRMVADKFQQTYWGQFARRRLAALEQQGAT
jgi:hypothetical protein